MSVVDFSWKGNSDNQEGLAVYEILASSYELWLPNLAKARQIEQALNDVFNEGRRFGHREMYAELNTTMTKVINK
jgi:hypothetical protein